MGDGLGEVVGNEVGSEPRGKQGGQRGGRRRWQRCWRQRGARCGGRRWHGHCIHVVQDVIAGHGECAAEKDHCAICKSRRAVTISGTWQSQERFGG